MTRDAVLGKLTEILDTPPRDGRDLMYGLVKIRKIIEHDAEASQYWVLRFFCDWALHTKLTRDLAQRIMNILDERLGHYVPGVPESLDSDGMAWELFSFTLFGRQLLDFFQQHDLPRVWVEDWPTWQKVCALYGEEVRDTPLEIIRKNRDSRYLHRVVITSFEPSADVVEANPNRQYWGLNWQLTLNDGSTFEMPYTRIS